MSNATEADTTLNGLQAMAALPENMMLMKIQQESVQAMAVAHPRSVAKILADIKEQFELSPAFAAAAVYVKPIGKAYNPQTRKYDGEQQYATGLSIRAAEMLFTMWGYTSVRSRIDEIDENRVRVTVTAFDNQNGNTWEESGILSRAFKNRNGQMQTIPEDRFLNLTCKADVSKRAREALLRLVSPVARFELLDAAKAASADVLDEKWLQKTIGAFQQFKIGQADLERIVGRPMLLNGRPNWTTEHRQLLLGVFNRLRDGDATAEQILEEFAEAGDAPAETVAPPAEQKAATVPETVKAESFANPTEVKETAYERALREIKEADGNKALKAIKDRYLGEETELETVVQMNEVSAAIEARRAEIERTPPEDKPAKKASKQKEIE